MGAMKVSSNSSVEDFVDEKSWPPGFRFHPTDEELVLYYLKRKICGRRHKLEIIKETDVYKWEPEELPGLSLLKNGDRQWFFFSPRDRKYSNGARSSRATRHGYWKATGKDRHITCNSRIAGIKKTLVFYRGRAPNGERTDWVMHEYSLDEDEIKRCQSVQDYYALYKVYKKSGPGPKNGEHYGAPFKEEEWSDEDNLENCRLAIQEDSVTQFNGRDDHCQPLLNDMEEIWKQISDDPNMFEQQANDFVFPNSQDFVEEKPRSNLVLPSIGEPISSDRSNVLQSCKQQYDVQPNLGLTKSAASYLQSCEAPEVTSAPCICQQDCQRTEEDFLEMNDLIIPEPNFPIKEGPDKNVQFEEMNGFNGTDRYFDADMFLPDIGPIDDGTAPYPYFDIIENNMSSQLDYQLPSESDGAHQISSQLWADNQTYNVYESTGSKHMVMAPSVSGVVDASIPSCSDAAQSQGGSDSSVTEPWLTSSLWTFLESIPSHPASASENVLINRALKRMSSFNMVRINAKITNLASSKDNVAERQMTRKGGCFFLPILGVVCAVIWMLMMGTPLRFLKNFLGRFISQ